MSKWKNAKKVRISSERNSGNACIMCHARPIMGGWVPHISAKCQCVQNIVPHISANGVQQQARGRSLHCFPELLQLAKCHLHLFFWFCQDLAHADVTCQYCFLQLHGMAWHATWEQVMFPCGMSSLQVIHNRFNLFGYFELATVSTFYFWGNIKFWKKGFVSI